MATPGSILCNSLGSETVSPETGKEIWSYEVKDGAPATRGLEYWAGDRQAPAEIFFGTSSGKLIALNAKTGKLVPGFGHPSISTAAWRFKRFRGFRTVRSDEWALENSPLTVTATGDGHTETWSSSLTARRRRIRARSGVLLSLVRRRVDDLG